MTELAASPQTKQPLITVRPMVFCDEDIAKPRNEQRFLLVRRASGHQQAGMWELPGGKPDNKPVDYHNLSGRELSLGTGLRELLEEAGVVGVPITRPIEVGEREIPDGIHAGEIQRVIGFAAMAGSSIKPPNVAEVDAAVWVTLAQVADRSDITEGSRMVINHFLPH